MKSNSLSVICFAAMAISACLLWIFFGTPSDSKDVSCRGSVVNIEKFSKNYLSWGNGEYYLFKAGDDSDLSVLETSTMTVKGFDTDRWCLAPGKYGVALSKNSLSSSTDYALTVCSESPVDAHVFPGTGTLFTISQDGTCKVEQSSGATTTAIRRLLSSKALPSVDNMQRPADNVILPNSIGDYIGDFSADFSLDFSEELSDHYSGGFSDMMSTEYSSDSFSGMSGDYSASYDFSLIVLTDAPTTVPTTSPTFSPTALGETVAPTTAPTRTPTLTPTKNPTRQPTLTPTRAPTGFPTSVPTSIYDTLEASERTKSCYSDCSYPGMTVQPADWGQEEYCAFYASTTCTEQSVSQDLCTPTCLTDCVDVFCDTMSTLVYACDSDSTETYADKTALENQCLDASAANAETETLLIFSAASSFDDVSAAEMEASEDAKTAARTTMSLAMSGVPVNQIVITDISDSSTRRQLQGGSSRKLTTSTEVTYQITAKLEALGFKSTDGDAAYSSLTGQISNSVSSGAFQQNLKASGQTIGVTTFSNAKVIKTPSYSEPDVVSVVTTTPTSMPSRAPSALSERGGGDNDDGGISDGIIAVIVIFSIIGCIAIVIGAYYIYTQRQRKDLENQFLQHNFLASKPPNASKASSGSRGSEVFGMDSDMEAKRASDMEARRLSEGVDAVEMGSVRPPSTAAASRKASF